MSMSAPAIGSRALTKTAVSSGAGAPDRWRPQRSRPWCRTNISSPKSWTPDAETPRKAGSARRLLTADAGAAPTGPPSSPQSSAGTRTFYADGERVVVPENAPRAHLERAADNEHAGVIRRVANGDLVIAQRVAVQPVCYEQRGYFCGCADRTEWTLRARGGRGSHRHDRREQPVVKIGRELVHLVRDERARCRRSAEAFDCGTHTIDGPECPRQSVRARRGPPRCRTASVAARRCDRPHAPAGDRVLGRERPNQGVAFPRERKHKHLPVSPSNGTFSRGTHALAEPVVRRSEGVSASCCGLSDSLLFDAGARHSAIV